MSPCEKDRTRRHLELFRVTVLCGVFAATIALTTALGSPIVRPMAAGSTLTPASLVTAGVATDLGNGVYGLIAPITIPVNDTLALPAGTTLRPIVAGVSITIQGRLDAQGTASSPILLGDASSVAWGGITFTISARASTLKHVVVRGVHGTAINLSVTDTTVSSTFENITITSIQGTALFLQNIPAKATHVFRNITITDAGTGVRLKDAAGVGLENFSVSSLNASGPVKAAVWFERGGAGTRIVGSTFAGPGIVASRLGAGEPGADSLTIDRCSFTGSSTETAIDLARSARTAITNSTFSGYGVGISAQSCAGLRLTNLALSSCGTAIRLQGIPRFAQADTIAFTPALWLEIGDSVSHPWPWSRDEEGSELSLPGSGPFPFAGFTSDSIAVFADGHARLVRNANDYAVVSGGIYEGKSSALDLPVPPAIFAFADDLDFSGDTSTSEGFGLRSFRPGDTDLRGNTAAETVTVLEWRAFMADDDPARRNSLAVHLYPDGRIRWLFLDLPYIHTRHGFYAGAYGETGSFEITAAVNPTDTSIGYAYTPGFTPILGTRVDTCTITGNTVGVQADSAARLVLAGSSVTGNGTGISVGNGLDSVLIAGSNLVGNTTADIAVTATSGSIAVTNSYMGASPILSGNTGLITISSPSGTPIGVDDVLTSMTDNAGCLLTRFKLDALGIMDLLRSLRDDLLEFAPFRGLVGVYYWL